jgi:hypothetical protein
MQRLPVAQLPEGPTFPRALADRLSRTVLTDFQSCSPQVNFRTLNQYRDTLRSNLAAA